MSTQLLAEPLPEVAAVLLTVTEAPAGALVITRTDANGTRPVRLLADQAPIGGSLTVRDYEPALSGPVAYSVDGQRTNLLTPAQAQPTALVGWTGSSVTLGAAPWNAARQAVRVVSNSAGTTYMFSASVTGTVAAGSKVTVSALVQCDAGVWVWPSVHVRTGNSYLRGVGTGAYTAPAVGAPIRVSHTAVLPAAATDLDLALLLGSSAAGGAVPVGQGVWVGDVLIEVTAPDGTTSYIEGTQPATVAATVDLGLARAVVAVPTRPARRSDSGVVTGWSEPRDSGAIVHQVPGRADPIVLAGKLRLRAPVTATVRFPTYAEAAAAADLASDGDTVQLRQPDYPGMDLYARVERTNVTPAEVDGQLAAWECTYTLTEVAAPTAALSGAADWTLADVAATAATLAQLRATFPTLRALAVGP